MSEEFRAYYYSFDATGNEAIDKILHAVARAGKAYHNTSEWYEEDQYGGEPLVSYAERIQIAANDAAKTLNEVEK